MTWKMNDTEFEAILVLPNEHRYEYFIKRVADWGEMYSLWGDEGWVLAGAQQDRELIPVWPHARFAGVCARGPWLHKSPRPIEIHDWLDRWTPGLIHDQRMVAVFPILTSSLQGIVVSPERLKTDITAELLRIE